MGNTIVYPYIHATKHQHTHSKKIIMKTQEVVEFDHPDVDHGYNVIKYDGLH